MTNKHTERRPYLLFEKEVTSKLDSLFRTELDPEIKEMIRLQTLKTRIFCRDYWTAIGKEVPKRIKFSEE